MKKIFIIDSSVCTKFPFISFLLEEKLLLLLLESCIDEWTLYVDMNSFSCHILHDQRGVILGSLLIILTCDHFPLTGACLKTNTYCLIVLILFFSTFATDWMFFVDKSLWMIYKIYKSLMFYYCIIDLLYLWSRLTYLMDLIQNSVV